MVKLAIRLTILLLACWLILNSAVAAEGAGEKGDLAELAKQEQNPLARLIRVQLEDNAQFGFGPNNDVLNFLRIQHVDGARGGDRQEG